MAEANTTIRSGLLRLIRPKQWVKNTFVLAPLVFAGALTNLSAVGASLLAMLCFCLASSAVYVINDYLDIERDRKHPIKSQTRPLASGQVTRGQALALLGALVVLTALVGSFQPAVLFVIGLYVALNVAYSAVLKHQPVIDIFTIAIGFVLRVYAGATALSVPVSSWMFVTTLCLALYLAAGKRRQELVLNGTSGRNVLGQYSIELVDRYAQMSATGALLFYSLFVVTTRPELVVTVPFVLFGLFRYWFIIDALDGGESPTDALFRDPQLAITVLSWVAVVIWSQLTVAGMAS